MHLSLLDGDDPNLKSMKLKADSRPIDVQTGAGHAGLLLVWLAEYCVSAFSNVVD